MSTEENLKQQENSSAFGKIKSREDIFSRISWLNWLIKSGNFDEIDIPTVLQDYSQIRLIERNKYDEKIIIIREAFEASLQQIGPRIAKYFNCDLEEILFNFNGANFVSKRTPYAVILGSATFYSTPKSLGDLQIIEGYASFEGNSQITSLNNLLWIGEDAKFSFSGLTDLGKLQGIGGNAIFVGVHLKSFGDLQSIGGEVYFGNNKELEELFYSQFERDGDGWRRKLTAKVDDGLKV